MFRSFWCHIKSWVRSLKTYEIWLRHKFRRTVDVLVYCLLLQEDVCCEMGMSVRVALTFVPEPSGPDLSWVGELNEVLACLTGQGPPHLHRLVCSLGIIRVQ